MGFASGKNGTPMLAWEELYKPALKQGTIRAMLERYSHIRMEAKRKALESVIAKRQNVSA